MKIISPFEAIKLSATKPGDLVRIANSQAPLALIIHEEGGKRVAGVLTDNADNTPFHIVFERDYSCFRYAPSWVLKLSLEEAQYARSDFSGRAGTIHVGKSGIVMNFGSVDARTLELTVNLGTFEWDDVESGAAAFPSWQIWASEDDICRPDAKPIFRFPRTTPSKA